MRTVTVALSMIAMLGMGACFDPSVDERAHELIDRLGPLCENFDFQLKEKVGDGEVRPVECRKVNDDDPLFTLFVFSSIQTRDGWVPMEGGGSVGGDDWIAISDDPSVLAELRDRLEE